MIEEAILNAFISYNKNTPGKKTRFLKFKLEYIRSILIPLRNENVHSHLVVPTKSIHFLELIPPTPKKVNPRGRCVYATKKKQGRKFTLDVNCVTICLHYVQHHALKFNTHENK